MSNAPKEQEEVTQQFQASVQPWLMACFGEMIAGDREERNHRFLEEALELVQACGCSASEAHQLVDYVYGRSVGELHQEIGGVMVTLAALCLANDADMHAAGWVELDRIWGKVEAIRAKQAAKPKHSPLPMALSSAHPDNGVLRERVERALERIGSIETPMMGGDNLAVTLCSHFDNPDQPNDDETGWSEDATTGCDEVIKAITEHVRNALGSTKP
jgi:hypothetical protein